MFYLIILIFDNIYNIEALIKKIEVLIIIDLIKALESKLIKAFTKEVEVLIIIKLINISRDVKSAKDSDNLKL